MRMVRVTLSCGCAEIVRYQNPRPYADLPEGDRLKLQRMAAKQHTCRKPKPSAAPPMSTVPQKP